MKKPQLIIMAAGLGSRFGGMKQMAPVDQEGHWIIDFSIFDAIRAGFGDIVLIIKEENEPLFRETLGRRIGDQAKLIYVHQKADLLPPGFSIPEGRVKPWGTAHAVLCAKDVIDAPFAAINADDYYGPGAFQAIYDFLTSDHPENEHAMVGYRVENTLTENGSVSRGVCQADGSGAYLTGIVERTRVEPRPGGAAFTEDDGNSWSFLPAGTIVSMNFWGFNRNMMQEIDQRFAPFLRENLPKNPLKCEYFLPLIPNQMMAEGTARVRIIPTTEKWFGITYHDDLPALQAAIAQMKEKGLYPASLWRK
ncbi:MAG: nucleotidyltransferase [Clostridia bacterium]|nr:nucleotidyltransferase [Clostridia bacterium]